MENKIMNIIQFYMFTNELKNKIRSGWKAWNIKRQRVESVAEHIYGTAMLAIAIESEFDEQVDLQKILTIILIHEIEEIIIGDLTPFDKTTKEEKRKMGRQAVEKVFSTLTKKYKYIDLIEEFEEMKTKEAIFAKMCDKLEADIQCKIYCEENSLDIKDNKNEILLQDKRVKRLIENGACTVADLFIENDKRIYNTEFEKIANFIENNNILNNRR